MPLLSPKIAPSEKKKESFHLIISLTQIPEDVHFEIYQEHDHKQITVCAWIVICKYLGMLKFCFFKEQYFSFC